ncbi:MAG: helix-turn-helix transcriptional regulator [Acaryochloris sp. RU_4_1]|nr:helix-turn-helix transcriptional regulator [Leptolyngbyaceae cyanobacterium SU_3_3]NJM66722.1 helix-turn-helix transcriptional regulator [Acaryochloris sp. RU_4_1]NJR55541.1 helix-turn-helix transcriptional regulator [Acaryochloris sp. CRU_2_0]
MPKDTYIPCLLQLFRQYGYDGATLARISEATGLGKASLYHHFPGGKDEMVQAVMDYLERWLAENVLPSLQGNGTALEKLQRMCDRLSELYEAGRQPCMSATLLLGSARDLFHARVQARYCAWINSVAQVLVDAGLNSTTAQQRGEDMVITIQGSLIVAQGLDNPDIFQRSLQQLPQQLCRNLAT